MAIQGVDSGGNLIAANAAGALYLVDTADASYTSVVAANTARIAALTAAPVLSSPLLGGPPILFSDVPVNGTNFVKTITVGGTPTGGSFKLGFNGAVTPAIAWSATNATLVANILAALNTLETVYPGDMVVAVGSMTAGIGTITITGAANLAKVATADITVASNDLTGTSPTVAVAQTTPGVTATARGALKGIMGINTALGKLHINTGTQLEPVWTVVGAQT